MYEIKWSDQFAKDLKLCQKKRRDIGKFTAITKLLSSGSILPGKYKDHSLSGN